MHKKIVKKVLKCSCLIMNASPQLQINVILSGSRDGAVVEHLPPMQAFNVARVRFLDSVSYRWYVGWVCCWFSSLLREVFLWVLRFSPLLKNQHFQIPIDSEKPPEGWANYLHVFNVIVLKLLFCRKLLVGLSSVATLKLLCPWGRDSFITISLRSSTSLLPEVFTHLP